MRDYEAEFLARRGRLIEASRVAVQTTARSTIFDVRLTSDTGLQVLARLRVPSGARKFPGVVLAAGLITSLDVIELVGEVDGVAMLAIDYGWRGAFDMSTLPGLSRTLRAMQSLSTEAVPRLMLALEFLAAQPEVDAPQVALVGVSYGSYIGLAAAALAQQARRVILVQGGGRIRTVLAAHAPQWNSVLPPQLMGWLGERLFATFRPEHWIGRIAPRRVTFIASRNDTEFPVAAVEEIFSRAGQPKEMIWRDTPHVKAAAGQVIAALAQAVIAELGAAAAPT